LPDSEAANLYQSHTWPVAPVGVTTSGHVTPGTVAKPAGGVGVTGVPVENRKCQIISRSPSAIPVGAVYVALAAVASATDDDDA
jgi:hypothetical protein